MASEQAIGMLTGQALAQLTAEIDRLATLTNLPAPALPTDREPRLQAAKRLDVLARFLAEANDVLAAAAAKTKATTTEPEPLVAPAPEKDAAGPRKGKK